MTEWTILYALPNIRLGVSVENGDIALVPQDDERIGSIVDKAPNARRYLASFTDAFGAQVRPAVLIVRPSAPKHNFNTDALGGFRDLIVASVVPYARAVVIRGGNIIAPLYSDNFSFYPWVLGKDDAHVLNKTPATTGLQLLKEFSGQSSPEIVIQDVSDVSFDKPLIGALMKRWNQRYSRRSHSRSDLALFRSLNMANHAARIPGFREVTLYDYGRSMALWVSAMEILPRSGDQSGVSKLIDANEWVLAKSNHLRYRIVSKNQAEQVNLPTWLLKKIYRARNDFLHGNNVSRQQIVLPKNGQNVFFCCAVLYRLVLTSFLSLQWKKRFEKIIDNPSKEYADMDEVFARQRYQGTFENALQRPSEGDK